jgi:hypothetical protein
MTKAAKELIIVFLIGAGVLTLMWGFLYQINTALIPGQIRLVHHIMWNAVGSGAGLIVLSLILGLFIKPAK